MSADCCSGIKCEPAKADIAVIGLAVMGQNLILNMNDNGFKVCAFNRTVSKVSSFLNNEAKGTKIIGANSLEEMVNKLKNPRIVMLMVKAGKPVDDFIELLIPLLHEHDIIIDGGNSFYKDTQRRYNLLKKHGMYFVGCGVSGGEEGARHGPSLMPGGAAEAWPHIKNIFQSIAAKVNNEPCCQWIGNDGAGHYVKMVHNGIEYGDMQLICESYHFLREVQNLSHDEMAAVFEKWNQGELDSFLIEMTAHILKYKDVDGKPLVTKIRDSAGQKGTGKWTAESALDMGVPVSLIAEAVFARCLSAMKERAEASSVLPQPASARPTEGYTDHVKAVRSNALYASKIISYAQGFMLLQKAASSFGWNLNFCEIAKLWRGGCIIRSAFLKRISEAYSRNPNLDNLLFDQFFCDAIKRCQFSLRKVVSAAVLYGLPVPAFSSALAFYDGLRCPTLPANLIQALRDNFGAHTYERIDNPGVFVHTDWTGHGGRVASSTYSL
ncbi:unnamed protein product [Soboliphyme baturini]|uniref:6-phosphogluconate dehydrogenase, decarboxylating n=1 Tax=Soboliphyme baturini TaxID=241478 RepID=A0A183IXM9_9BILA|nr:unnamed protein product [Soboliphyme baturini]